MGKFKGITSPIYNLDGGGDKKRQNYSKWIKCTVETLLLFLHVVEFGGSCLVFQSNHFFHTILDFSFNMSSFLFYLQGCCSSMYTCVCVLLTVDVASAGTGAPGDDICGRVHGHSGRNSRHQLWAVQTQAAFSRLRVEDFNFSLHASDGDAVVADPFRAEREHPTTGLRVVSNGYFRFRGRDGRVPHADAVVVARG
jgi:hypothetical protein